MPPNTSEIMQVQEKLLSVEGAKLFTAIKALRDITERSEIGKHQLTPAELVQIENLPIFAAIAKNGAPFRFFVEHLPEGDWEKFRNAATGNDEASLLEILQQFREFQEKFDAWCQSLDPDAVSALTDAIENINDPGAFEKARGTIDTFVHLLESGEE